MWRLQVLGATAGSGLHCCTHMSSWTTAKFRIYRQDVETWNLSTCSKPSAAVDQLRGKTDPTVSLKHLNLSALSCPVTTRCSFPALWPLVGIPQGRQLHLLLTQQRLNLMDMERRTALGWIVLPVHDKLGRHLSSTGQGSLHTHFICSLINPTIQPNIQQV